MALRFFKMVAFLKDGCVTLNLTIWSLTVDTIWATADKMSDIRY